MKFLFIALVFASVAFGKATVNLTPAWHYGDNSAEMKVGLSIFEPLILDMYYDGWVGGGAYTKNGTVWGATTQRLAFHLDENTALAFGGTFRIGQDDRCGVSQHLSNSELHVSLMYKLWD